jgi:hypothetical protein
MRRSSRAVLRLLPALATLGCPQRTAVWVIPGSTTSSLEFGISDGRGSSKGIEFGYLRVNPCAGSDFGPSGATWLLAENGVAPAYVNRVRYGVTPLGYRSEQGPVPLQPGCYRASTRGSHVEFLVRSDGTIAADNSSNKSN